MKALQARIESLERDLADKVREVEALKIRLIQSENLAREVVTKARSLSSATQHHLCFLDGTTRRAA